MLSGQVLAERFEIERSAGAGGMGIVYRALDLRTRAPVALKVLRQGPDVLADRFAREIELLSKLEHPHIIGYITHGTTADGLAYLVMPWLEGEDLHQRLRGGPLGVEETLTIATRVASALACLHEKGLVHRDLKPSNVFLPGGNVRAVQLIDLGIARQIVAHEPMTISGQLVGTPGYMAPEEARGDREVHPAIDIFALGCVLYECLLGRPLFSGSNVMAVLAKIILEEAPRARDTRRDVPEALDTILHRMVAKDPTRRPRDGAELGRWLAEMSGGAPSSVRVATPWAALTDNEQRIVTVLMAASRPEAPAKRTDSTARVRPRFEEMSSASLRFGVRVHPLADGTAIALAPEGMSAADKASVLARFGKHLALAVPDVRVALATGMAVTDGKVPVGEAIERGARIVNSTTSTGVRADDVSAALIESRFDIRRDGDAFVVDEERHGLDATRPLLGRPTACVGRDRELAILDATFRACIDEATPAVVLVTAPPGTGKSRLRHEFVRRLRGAGASWRDAAGDDAVEPLVLLVTGDPLLTSTAYALAAQIVRRAAKIQESEPAASAHAKLTAHVAERVPAAEAREVVDFVAELVGHPFDDASRPDLRAARESPPAMAERVRSAFERLARAWCEKQPVVLVLEDLHWADVESIKLVDRMIRAARGLPLFVLTLARPEVHDRFPALWAQRNGTEIHLAPLGERACTKIAREAMGAAVSNERIQRIVARSDGNAFFLEELIRASVEGDRGRDRSGAALPQTVIAVAQARLERLDVDERRVLRAASVFGETFARDGVCALVGQSASEVDTIVRRLVQNEAVAVDEGSDELGARELRFRHALLRGAAYASLTDADRALAHRLAAAWIESTGADLEVVAMHLLEAGDRAEAATRFTRAGEAHVSRAHADAAARCFLRALLFSSAATDDVAILAARIDKLAETLEATRGVDANSVTHGIERHVDVGATTGAARFVASSLAGPLDALRARGGASLPGALARAACAVGALGDYPTARTLVDEATAANDETGVARRAAAKVAYWQGDWGRVVELLLPLDVGESLDAEALLTLAPALVAVRGRDALAQGLECVARAERMLSAVRAGTLDALRCSKARLLCLNVAGEHARAAEVAAAGAELARQTRFAFEQMVHLHMLGELHIRLGDDARARTALAASHELVADPDDPVDRGLDEPLVAYLDGIAGARGAAARIGAVADRCRDASYLMGELHARYWLGRLLAATHDPGAVAELERAREIARRTKIRSYENDCDTALAALRV